MPPRPTRVLIVGYGRMGKLVDPFGHVWMLASRKESLTHEEVEELATEAPND